MASGLKLPGLWNPFTAGSRSNSRSWASFGIGIIFVILVFSLEVQASNVKDICDNNNKCTSIGQKCSTTTSKCVCSTDYLEENSKCRKDHKTSCSDDNDCHTGLKCLPHESDNSNYCLCEQSPTQSFWNAAVTSCQSVTTNLPISDLIITTTTTSVAFTWTDITVVANVKYRLSWNNGQSQVVISPKQFPGLTTGREYPYTLQAYLAGDDFYPERTGPVLMSTATTRKDHKMSCSVDNDCRTGLKCLPRRSDSQKYCLCEQSLTQYFWNAAVTSCQLVTTNLPISDLIITTTTTSVAFTWTDITVVANVKYRLSWNNGQSQVVISPKQFPGLTTGREYPYTLQAYLAGDDFYPERTGPVLMSTATTRKDHKMSCSVDNDCRTGLKCLPRRSDSQKYCLCEQSLTQYFWNAAVTSCQLVTTNLPISDLIITTTTTSVAFTWTDITVVANVKYRLSWNNGQSQVVISPKQFPGLTTGREYPYTLQAYLAGDDFYPERTGPVLMSTATTRKDHKMSCSVDNDCRTGLKCLPRRSDSQKYCLCEQSLTQYFWNAAVTSCQLVTTNLPISDLIITTTTTSVAFTWTDITVVANVKYRLSWNNGQSQVVISPKQFPGLTTGREYPYTLQAYLAGDDFYPERTGPVLMSTATTRKDHKMSCSVDNDCRTGLKCLPRRSDSQKYCLCEQSLTQYFWNAAVTSCQLVTTNLPISDLIITTTTTSVAFTWTDITVVANVKYRLSWNNGQSQVVISPKQFQGLTTGREYPYTLQAYLAGDDFYPERTGPVLMSTATTRKDHKMSCSVDNDCRTGLKCLPRRSDSQKYCLCEQSLTQYFWNAAVTSCQLVTTNLPISDLIITTTTTSVAFTWTDITVVANVKYRLSWNNGQSQVVISPKQFPGLTTGREYPYTLQAYLAGDDFYPERTGPVLMSTATTRKDHEMSCSVDNDCRTGLKCLPRRSDSQKYCLCEQSLTQYFWNAAVTSCQSVDALNITVFKVEKTTGNVTFYWNANDYSLGRVRYEMNWVNNGDQQKKNISASLSLVTDLTPGVQYTFTFKSIIDPDSFYEKRTTFATKLLRMRAAKPRPVNETTSQLSSNPMEVKFGSSEGVVKQYTVNLVSVADGSSNTSTVVTTFANFTLRNGAVYNYTITAYNADDEASEQREGSFMTATSKPSPVTSLNASSVKSNSINVTWSVPDYPNGNILGFVITISKGDTCVERHNKLCSDCSQTPTPPATPACASKGLASGFNADQVRINSNVTFSHQFLSLNPATTYTVSVFAFIAGHVGENNSKPFKTLEQSAENIQSINVTPARNDTAVQVYLDVTLIPGSQTGVTNFNVSLKDTETNNIDMSVVLTGYTNTTVRFEDLLADHEYEVAAFAETNSGRSPETTPKNVKTLYNKPGAAVNFQINPDVVYATKFTLSLNCPQQSERNGTIQKVHVTKTPLSNSQPEKFTFPMPAICELSLLSTQLASFTVSRNYSLSVVLEIENLQSNPSSDVYFFAAPKPPIFEADDKDVIVILPSSPSENSVELTVNVSLLLDDSQGSVILSGLMVCVKSDTNSCDGTSRRKRSNTDANDWKQYPTWAESQAKNFKSPYRATPDDWVQPTNSDVKYTVGSDTNCKRDVGVRTYCDGPLPSGREVVVTVFRCTDAGCAESDPFESKTKTPEEDTNEGLIIGIVVAVVVVLVVVVLLIIFFVRRRRKPKDMERIMISEYSTQDKRPIPIREFKDAVARYHKDANLLFQGEFEDIKTLSSQTKATTHEALKEDNRVKNRYVDILPYDHSRVKLQVQMENDDISDYINANYIPGFNSVREYIATQGPMHATMPHFWRMVWEQQTRVIVMLSDLTENNKLKVSLYWPENLNEPINYGDVLVEMTNFSQLNKYIIRNFRISYGKQSRRITHFFIPGWWDFSANLTFDDVLEFAQLVRKEATPPNSGPVLVHCSAGVGRTGTFIALDYFMQYIEKHGLDDDIDVFSYVMNMRKNRPRMVQAEPQYIFIFDALVEVIERKLKAEKERLYDNTKDEHIYNNDAANEENIYVNTANGSEDHTYSNEAFVGDSVGDYENMNINPTTVL